MIEGERRRITQHKRFAPITIGGHPKSSFGETSCMIGTLCEIAILEEKSGDKAQTLPGKFSN